MLETLSKGFRAARSRLTGVTQLTEDNIEPALREVRLSLLEADVALPVTKAFLSRVKEKALGQQVALRASADNRQERVTAEQHFIRICHEELVAFMGPANSDIQWSKKGPTIIMVVGLQGSGKTTTVGKLARYLQKTHFKKPYLVAADTYRPAAVKQLQILGEKLTMPVFSLADKTPVEICIEGCRQAHLKGFDVVLLDTAGRLAIDEPLMQELSQIYAAVHPQEVWFVCDAMIGQDAVQTAKAFHDRLATTGFILTKLDGDARGGAALSIKETTGQPIKFVGMGEHLDKLEEFRPEGLASRILGMGDIIGLMKDFEQVTDAEKAEKDAMRMLEGKFDMQDFLDQIGMLQQMGSFRELIEKIPFLSGQLPDHVNIDEKEFSRISSMIRSMTVAERRKPELLLKVRWEALINPPGKLKNWYQADRVRRIALGCGHKEQDVLDLLKRFATMRQMISTLGKPSGLMSKIPGLKQLSQLKQMSQLSQMSSMSGMDLPMMPALNAPSGTRSSIINRPLVDKNKEKRKRKAAKNARKRNR